MVQIEQLLREKIGLNGVSVGPTLIDRAARLRMKRLGLKTEDEYLRFLESFPGELNELTEAVVVTETWFFRDSEPFKICTRMILGEWLPRHPGQKVRILSVPCSTGEEPYSIAMSLLDAGLPSQGFLIDAIDISEHAVETARIAVYGKNSFRGKDFDFRKRHFTPTPQGFALNWAVRNCVRFQIGNLLDFPQSAEPYHFIFCRNLLIYFDAAAQGRALDQLRKMLSPDGVLLLGPAELPLAVNHGFVSSNIPMAFACHKIQPVSATRAINFPRSFDPRKTAPVIALPSLAARDKFSKPPSLETAYYLAENGCWSEVAEFCAAYLQFHEPTAPAFYLLGRAREADGNITDAETCYRKALYLDPHHHESLSQMVTLSEKKGDEAQVRAFQRRIKRAQSKTQSR